MAESVAKLQQFLEQINIAENLDSEFLEKWGHDLKNKITRDDLSRKIWLERYNDYMKLALQIKEEKNFPWPNAANVKFPLLTTAAMQFAARAYPAIVNNNNIVKGKVIGYDPTGQKAERADRIGKHMTYQLLEQMPEWDEEMDKLCMILPIAGCVFKKTWFDPHEGRNKSELILAPDFIVDYWAKSLSTTRRKTHQFLLYRNDIEERVRSGIYRKQALENLPEAADMTYDSEREKIRGLKHTSIDPEDRPYVIYECHCWKDLDEDGYEEPYIVTLDSNTGIVFRVVARYDLEDIQRNENGIVRIKPIEHFTKFGFIPNPDGGFYDVGFGLLLGHLNETVNTSINQLLDQGTMHTTGGGFIGKGIRLRGGPLKFAPNEWIQVPVFGDDIRKNILPLPTREPSAVLFNMLNTIVQSGKELASIAEIFTGKLPGQNTPATTTMATIEQGMKVFTAIYKRIHRSLKEEFQKLFKLNKKYMNPEEYFSVLDSQGNTVETGVIFIQDYETDEIDVVPASDPNEVTSSVKLLKAQALMELAGTGLINPLVAAKRLLDALEIPNAQELLVMPQQQGPSQEQIQAQQQLQAKQAEAQIKLEAKQAETELKLQQQQMKMQLEEQKLRLKELELLLQLQGVAQKHELDLQSMLQKADVKRQEDKWKTKQLQKKTGIAGKTEK